MTRVVHSVRRLMSATRAQSKSWLLLRMHVKAPVFALHVVLVPSIPVLVVNATPSIPRCIPLGLSMERIQGLELFAGNFQPLAVKCPVWLRGISFRYPTIHISSPLVVERCKPKRAVRSTLTPRASTCALLLHIFIHHYQAVCHDTVHWSASTRHHMQSTALASHKQAMM